MKSTFVMAQLQALPDPKDNLEKAEQAIKDAKAQYNPDFMVFPERFMFQYPEGTDRKTILSASQPINGPFVTAMRKLAKEYGVWMVFGMNETVHDDNDDRNYNTSVMVDNNGEIKGTYRKTHLYDAFGHQESADTKPGNELFNPVMTPFGKFGCFRCYKIRFPESAGTQTANGGLHYHYAGSLGQRGFEEPAFQDPDYLQSRRKHGVRAGLRPMRPVLSGRKHCCRSYGRIRGRRQ